MHYTQCCMKICNLYGIYAIAQNVKNPRNPINTGLLGRIIKQGKRESNPCKTPKKARKIKVFPMNSCLLSCLLSIFTKVRPPFRKSGLFQKFAPHFRPRFAFFGIGTINGKSVFFLAVLDRLTGLQIRFSVNFSCIESVSSQ